MYLIIPVRFRVDNPGDDIVEARWLDINTELPYLAFNADKHLLEMFIALKKQGNKLTGIPLDGSFFNVLENNILEV